MPGTKDSGGGMHYGPRKDRRATKRLLNRVSAGKNVSQKDLRHIHGILARSQAQGTLNAKDQRKVAKLTHALTAYRSSPGGENYLNRSGQSAKKYDKSIAGLSKYSDQSGFGAFLSGMMGDASNSINPKKHKPGNVGSYIHDTMQGASDKINPKNNKAVKGAKNRTKPNNKTSKGGSKKDTNPLHGAAAGQPTSVADMVYRGLMGGGGGPGSNSKSDRTQAQTLVQREINQQVKGLLDQIKQQKGTNQYDINKINALYDRTKGDLNYVFGEAKDYMGAQGQKIDQQYGATRNQLQGDYSNYQQQAAQQVAANRGNAMSELERLGIQQSGLGNFDADAANMQNVAGVNQQNALANLGTMQQGTDEISALLGSMSQASLASAVGRATNERQDQIGDARQDYRTYFQKMLDNINNIKAQRPQMVNELATSLQNNRWQQNMDLAQMNFQNQLATNNFNLDVAGLNSDNTWKYADQRQRAAELRWEKQKQKAIWQGQNLAGQVAGAANNVIGGIFG